MPLFVAIDSALYQFRQQCIRRRKLEVCIAFFCRSQIVTGRGCRYIPRAIFRTLLSFQKSDTMFLKGIRKPVTTEVFRKQLLVEGKVPKELNGVYIRTGPNPQFQPLGGYHW